MAKEIAKEITREKRLATIFSCMAPEDITRLNELAKSKGTKPSVVLRDAALWYLDHHDKLAADSKETEAVRLIKKLDQRLSGLIIQVLIDVGIIINLMWKHLHPETADADLAWARKHALLRLQQKKKASKDPMIKELVQ